MKVRKASVKKKSSLRRNCFRKISILSFLRIIHSRWTRHGETICVISSEDFSVLKDKIRKSSTILDGPDSSNDMDSAKHNPLISSSALSCCKDTVNINIGQQIMDEIFEKAKKASPIGTEKTWVGKIYIKTGIG